MIMCIGQRYYVLLFLIGLCTAARQRVRTPDVSTSTSNRDVRARQLEFARQPEVVENVWDNIDVQKLDEPSEKIESWRRAGYPNASSSTTVADNRDRLFIENTANGLEERQAYPEVPIGGPIGEVPRPLPTRPTQPPYPPNPPSSPLGCLAPRGQFPSPNSCANYLNCWDDVVIEQQCPLGLLFNDLTNVCDFDYNVNCGSRPGPTPKPSLPSGSKHCPDENGRYRSTTNCSEFYVCLAGQPIKFNCPPGLVYNDEYGVCDYVYNVDCGSAVTPKPTPPPTEPPTRPPPSYPSNPPTRPPTRPPSSYPSNPPTRPPTQPPTSRPPSYPTAPSRPTRPPPTQYPQQPSYPPQQPSYPPQQPGYPPQQPAYPPQQPAYPPPAYPAPAYPQPSYPQAQTQTTPEVNVPEEVGFNNPWNVAHDLPDDIDDDIPCNDNEVKKLDEFCTSVVVCRNRQRALVQCSTGFTYDTPSDSCKPFTIAKC